MECTSQLFMLSCFSAGPQGLGGHAGCEIHLWGEDKDIVHIYKHISARAHILTSLESLHILLKT